MVFNIFNRIIALISKSECSQLNEYEVFTDGSVKLQRGAWAFIIIQNGKLISEAAGFVYNADNNRMELQAAIEALKQLPNNSKVTLYSDSRVLIDAVLFLPKWKKNGWLHSKKLITNYDLYKCIDTLNQQHHIVWKWVRAHANITHNEYCDYLCIKTREKGYY